MDAVIDIIVKVAECFVDPIKRRSKLITNYQSIKKDLKNEHRELSSMLSSVQNQVKQAQNNGEKVMEEVSNWLGEAQSTKDEVNNTWLNSIDDLQTKCGPCPKCCMRYKLSKKAMKNKENIKSLVERGSRFPPVAFPPSPKGINLISHGEFTAFDSMTLSFNEVLAALKKNENKVIGVLGMGGIGKTTLVTEVGRVAKQEKMFDQVVFVVMSQAPDIRKIQGQLGDMLGLTFSKESNAGRADQLRECMKKINKILVIVDDIWDKVVLSEIGIPFGKDQSSDHKGCKILLTTRRESVCTSASMNCQVVIRLNLLEEEEAWELFKMNVGEVLNDPSPQLENVAKQVMAECNRLPLALVVVACALSGKNLEEDWQSAAENLKRGKLEEIDEVDSGRNVYSCFRLSYDYLKGEDIKKCFLLCSLFPEDHEISVDELAMYAMGFGLCEDTADSITAVKTRVERMLKDLKSSSLLLKTDMTNHVKMHDMVRDAAIWITSKDDEPFIVPTTLDKNWARSEKIKEAMAISLLACPDNRRFPVQPQCPRLKILVCAQRVPLEIRSNSFEGLTTLRVLDLTAAKNRLKMVLPPSLKCLQNLRTLLLRRWKLEGDISIIGSLKNLEILSFSGSLFKELPIELAELYELRLLDLSGCRNLASSYTQVQGKLKNLKVIYTPNQQATRLTNYDEDGDEDDKEDEE